MSTEEPVSGEVALADLLSDDRPTRPLTREAFEAGVQAMRDWKPPESWTDYCPACSARGYRRACVSRRHWGGVLLEYGPGGPKVIASRKGSPR